MSELHKTLIRRFVKEIHNKGNLGAVDEFIHPQHVRHSNLTVGGGRDFHGPEGFRQAIAIFRRGFSDVHFTEEDLLVDGDRAALRWTFRGTHTGEFNGIPPTGKRIRSTGVDIYRITDGKLVERWAYDDGSLLAQLGTPDERPSRRE